MSWYCAVAKRFQETAVEERLERQGFSVYLPMCEIANARKPQEPRTVPLLAPYLFVFMDVDDRNERWRHVYSTRGVQSVISSGERPMSVPNWVIEEIKAREVGGLVKLKPKDRCRFKAGDTVRVKGSGLDAIFDEPVDNRRAAIFLSLLGKPHRLIVPLAKLSAAAVVPMR